jgi:hypothetical protein
MKCTVVTSSKTIYGKSVQNQYNPIDEILDAIDIKYIENYIRKKKLKNLNKDEK